jgi:hypothetical protein
MFANGGSWERGEIWQQKISQIFKDFWPYFQVSQKKKNHFWQKFHKLISTITITHVYSQFSLYIMYHHARVTFVFGLLQKGDKRVQQGASPPCA